jgi:hypothetical protein
MITIDLDDFPNKFSPYLENANIIAHYINRDYTVKVFLHPDCTKELLNQGYFKINSRDLHQAIFDQLNS